MADWDFIEAALTTHNHWRQRHGIPSLRYNRDLERIAQGWAVHIANTGQAMSSANLYMRRPLGENIAIKGSREGEDYTGREVSDVWYSGITRYDFQNHTGEDTGQFTQMVWRDTEEMGIGKAFTDDGRCVVVANYFPAGNIVGYYPYNVLYTTDGKVTTPGDGWGADTGVKKNVTVDKVREVHGGIPYLRTIITETIIKPDGTKSVITKQQVDQL